MKIKGLCRIFLLVGITINCFGQSLPNDQVPTEYTNPIIRGMNPDPSICRVGDDYYLVTSSFGFFPGLPVYHSKDLVNWKLIGYGIDRPSQLKLTGNDRLNLFAATIRYHQGVFYIINTNTGRNSHPDRNFVITATNPAGPWSDAHYIPNAEKIDPSLFFDDDGKVYYTGNIIPEKPLFEKQRDIWIQEINPKSWQLEGKKVDVIKTDEYIDQLKISKKDTAYYNNFEGPHLYKKDGNYYVLVSHGGTGFYHALSIWKGKNVFGPYEAYDKNPIVTHRHLPRTNALVHTGHGDIVQTQNKEWWMVLLNSRPFGGEFTNLGRETSLVPLEWGGDWPVVNPSERPGEVMVRQKRPNLKDHPWPVENPRDNFDGNALNLNWNFIQTPLTNWWKLNEPKGHLKINLRPDMMVERSNPSFIGKRQTEKSFTATAKMEFTPKADQEAAGIAIVRDVSNNFQLLYTFKNRQKYIQLIENDGLKQSTRLIAEKVVDAKLLYLKIEAKEQDFSFLLSKDGKAWEKLAENVDGRSLSSATGIGRFTGILLGMYATSNGKESSNSALFDWFDYSVR